ERPAASSSAVEQESSLSEPARLFAPGAGAPTGPRRPGALPRAGTPGRDEHQLVRGAAGDLVHRASRGTRLVAPAAGAPTGPRRPGALPRAGTLRRDEHQL